MTARYATITSFQNPKVKLAQKLLEKRQREEEKLFVVDAARDLARALAQGYEAAYILYSPTTATPDEHALIATPSSPVYQVTPDILAKASYRENPGGLVAVLRQPEPPALTRLQATHILALVDLRKPGNIGALLRTADAAGFGGILLIDTALDLYNPNIIRSSTGACFLGNIYTATAAEAIAFLRGAGYQLIAAHLAGTASIFDVDLRPKSALILGAEADGLSALWVEACDQLVKIPMQGQITDSLNVSVSGAILMYEALRQRLQSAGSDSTRNH